MRLSDEDTNKVLKRYRARWTKYGHSQRGVGWGKKGRQGLRFQVLASYWTLKGKRILDIGAGFGDLFPFLKKYSIKSYQGIEIVPELAEQGRKAFGRDPQFDLQTGDFLALPLKAHYDIAFISGLFNFRLVNGGNYRFIQSVLSKALTICEDGVACNFITDRVDYHNPLIFNARPERILQIGLSLTRNLALKNDYFPFEYSLFLNKNDSFSKKDAVFHRYKHAW
jgi:SAM-dependent methyltransferase